VQLTVNTTPAHSTSSKLNRRPAWLMAGGGATLACVFLLILPRRRWRNAALLILLAVAIVSTVVGCGSPAKIDPGTAKGTYTVVVAGTAGSGSLQYQASVNVPISIK
jgi:peptidoglycan/LPS O-acetylase OafA/YrhL